MANQLSIEYDDMDVMMSQIDTNVFIVDEVKMPEDEMDEIMSQIDTEVLYELEEEIDVEAGIPQELLQQYQEAMGIVKDDLIEQMEEEADPEVEPELPSELLEEYQKAMDGILPKTSSDRYMQAYEVFRTWQKSYRTTSLDEKIVMAYFRQASTKYKPSTLWSMYSMIKKTLICKHNVDLKGYCRLRAFLKTNADGFKSKQSEVFTPDEIKKLIVEAPNASYLAMKVVVVFGVIGACRCHELIQLTIKNVKDNGNEISVHIPKTKTKEPKDYIIAGEMAKIIREYMKLRPVNAKTDRLLMQYRKGKCVNQVMGKHSIAKVPKEIATFLQLPEPNLYTGHSYRGTGTTIAADAGASMEELKRLGPWKSITVCEQYIRNSKAHKRKMGNLIGGAINLPSTSTANTNSNGRGSEKICLPFALGKGIESSTEQPILDLSSNENLPFALGVESSSGSSAFNESSNKDDDPSVSVCKMASDAVKLISYAGKPLVDTLKGLKVQAQRDGAKENVIFHFGAECHNFTIINLN